MSDQPSHPCPLQAWLRLVRVPNLLTVPGDVLAGWLLAGVATPSPAAPATTTAALAVAAVLAIYMAGLISNDRADIDEDRRDRPGRPLPSGAIPIRTAALAAGVLAVGGIGLAQVAGPVAGGVAGLLVIIAAAYNFRLKRHRRIGPPAMGLCRGLSLVLGAGTAGWRLRGLIDPVVIAAAGLTLTVAAITAIARDETDPPPGIVWRAGGPALVMSLCFLALFLIIPPTFPALVWAVAATLGAARAAIGIGRHPTPRSTGLAVGALIRNLLLVQATFLAATATRPGFVLAAIATLLLPLHAILSRRFPPT